MMVTMVEIQSSEVTSPQKVEKVDIVEHMPPAGQKIETEGTAALVVEAAEVTVKAALEAVLVVAAVATPEAMAENTAAAAEATVLPVQGELMEAMAEKMELKICFLSSKVLRKLINPLLAMVKPEETMEVVAAMAAMAEVIMEVVAAMVVTAETETRCSPAAVVVETTVVMEGMQKAAVLPYQVAVVVDCLPMALMALNMAVAEALE